MQNESQQRDLLPNDCQVGQYVVESCLETTSLVRAYKAKHSILNKTVALIFPIANLDDHAISKFLGAVRRATLKGQPLYDIGNWDGGLFVVVGYNENDGPLVDLSEWEEERLPCQR